MGGWGGVKVFAQKAPSSGETQLCQIHLRSNGNAYGCGILGRRFESWSVDGGSCAAAAFKPPTQNSTAACITIQPLLLLSPGVVSTA